MLSLTHCQTPGAFLTAESASAVPWSGVTGKPTTFTPETHTHAISEVADLQETLTGLRQDVNAKPSKDTNTTYSLIQDSTDGHKLTFKGSDGSTKTVTIPDNDHNDNTWRDVVDSLDSTRTDASLSANQGRILNDKFGGYLPLHGTADIAASVVDYGDTAKHIQIGFSGAGITGDDIKYIAGYTGGDGGNLSAKIKDISKVCPQEDAFTPPGAGMRGVAFATPDTLAQVVQAQLTVQE